MNRINSWLIFLILVIIMIGCSKYDHRTKKFFGENILISYTVNGIDSLDQFKDSLATNFEFHYDEINGINGMWIKGQNNQGETVFINGRWRTDINVSSFAMKFDGPIMGPLGGDKDFLWETVLLKKDRFVLKTNYNNKEYQIEFNN